MLKSPYNIDFYAWTQQQAQLLRNKQLSELDVIHLAEELEDMGAVKNESWPAAWRFCCCTC